MKQADIIQLQTAAGSIVTPGQDLGDNTFYAIDVIFPTATSLNGTLKLQSSAKGGTDWNDVLNSDQVIAATGATQHTWSVEKAGYRFVRAVWTYTSGAGTISSIFTLKETIQR